MLSLALKNSIDLTRLQDHTDTETEVQNETQR